MKIAIIGCGFVGNALINGLNADVTTLKIDPKFGTDIQNLSAFKPDAIFICVPTPMSSSSDQDLSILNSVIFDLQKISVDCLVIIKSTVLPNHIDKYKNKFREFVYNPEFLTERNANSDFINAELILFGGEDLSVSKLSDIYGEYTKCKNKNYFKTDVITASLIKYSINSFLATKVIFFNELFNVFKKSNSNEAWKNIIEIMKQDSRIGNSHMDVPGPDGRFGYGGACFPKDTHALLNYAEAHDVELNLLKTAINVNNNIRSEYNKLTLREKSQNVKFKGED
tara:strand:+ start:342 stop:1187 length:846 start_codon:yes stop_codon:yes gene_type:complete